MVDLVARHPQITHFCSTGLKLLTYQGLHGGWKNLNALFAKCLPTEGGHPWTRYILVLVALQPKVQGVHFHNPRKNRITVVLFWATLLNLLVSGNTASLAPYHDTIHSLASTTLSQHRAPPEAIVRPKRPVGCGKRPNQICTTGKPAFTDATFHTSNPPTKTTGSTSTNQEKEISSFCRLDWGPDAIGLLEEVGSGRLTVYPVTGYKR